MFLPIYALLFAPLNPPTKPPVSRPPLNWSATGTLLEACSCAVPCPCNFGESPTMGYCHTVYAYKLKKATYNGVTLDGLVFGGGEAEKGAMGYLDSRATPAQTKALEELAKAVFAKGGASGGTRKFIPTRITTTQTKQDFSVKFGESGGFAADLILGADGKTPIIVENNVTWPVKRFSKGKTTSFRYQDGAGNRIEREGVNANLGEFSLNGGASSAKAGKTGKPTLVGKACCTPKK